MIDGKWVNAGLDIIEVLLEKCGHVRVEALPVRNGSIGVSARPRFVTLFLLRRLR